jgi:hypothetical protein
MFERTRISMGQDLIQPCPCSAVNEHSQTGKCYCFILLLVLTFIPLFTDDKVRVIK